MAKALKFWNGNPYGILPSKDCFDKHVYIAAYSAEDARNVCLEAGLYANYPNLKKYFSQCWGDSMKGITPERGIWVVVGYNGTPKKINSVVALEGTR